MLPTIMIHEIDPKAHRYETVGDWQDATVLFPVDIRVSALGVTDFTFLVAIHELVEWYLCHRANISTQEVDTFDIDWKAHDGITEPGDDPAAPYHSMHQFASLIERMVAHELQIDWPTYEAAINRACAVTKRALRRRDSNVKDRNQGNQDRNPPAEGV